MSNQSKTIDLIKQISGQANVLTIPRIYISLFKGDHLTALLFSQCVYWSDRSSRTDGYFYKKSSGFDSAGNPGWEIELGMSKYQVTRAINVCKNLDVLSTKKKKASGAPTRHFKVNFGELEKLLIAYLESKETSLSESEVIEQSESKKTSLSLTDTTTETLIINLNGTSDRSVGEQEPPEAPESVEAYKHSNQPLHLPDSPLQAAQHLDLAPLVQLCGDLFIGRPDYEAAITAVRWIRDRQLLETHSNDDLINYLRPFWVDWCAGVRRSDGKPYAKNNIAWLRDHARINQRLAKPVAKGSGKKKSGQRAGKTTTFDRNMQAAASRLEQMQLNETENQNHAN